VTAAELGQIEPAASIAARIQKPRSQPAETWLVPGRRNSDSIDEKRRALWPAAASPPIFVAMFTPGFLSPGQRQKAAPVDHDDQRITVTNPCDPAAVFTSKNQSLQPSVRIKKGVRQEMP
jgi:hypothetical protein